MGWLLYVGRQFLMPSRKRLRSVCHSIAHHAVSGLSYVHPHVLRACRSAGLSRMSIQLLESEPCPVLFRGNEPLRLSLHGLKEKLEHILATEGFAMSDIAGAELTFEPDPAQKDDHCSICRALLVPLIGEPVESIVNYMGKMLHAQPCAPRGRSAGKPASRP